MERRPKTFLGVKLSRLTIADVRLTYRLTQHGKRQV